MNTESERKGGEFWEQYVLGDGLNVHKERKEKKVVEEKKSS